MDLLAELLNRDFPEVRESLALVLIETQLELLGAAVCPYEEDGLKGLAMQAFDINENLTQLKITFFPLTAKSKTTRSWFGAIPWHFYVRMHVEEMPELDEYTTDEKLDELFFAAFSTHQKHGADLIAFLFNSLREEYGLQVSLFSKES